METNLRTIFFFKIKNGFKLKLIFYGEVKETLHITGGIWLTITRSVAIQTFQWC